MTGIEAYNTSRPKLRAILADPGQVAGNLRAWIAAFEADTRYVIEKFDFDAQIGRLDRAKLLYLVLSKVTEVDLHPDKAPTSRWVTSRFEKERRKNAKGRLGLRPKWTDDCGWTACLRAILHLMLDRRIRSAGTVGIDRFPPVPSFTVQYPESSPS